MRDAVDYVEREGVSRPLRWVLALVALLFGAGMLAIASSTEAPRVGYAFAAFCLFVAAGCVTQGRVRHFILSTLGASLFIIGLAYVYSQLFNGPLFSPRSRPSLWNSILFLCLFGIPGLGYAARARFGFGAPAVASRLTRCEAADLIQRFLANQTDAYEWDDFTSGRYQDPVVEEAARRAIAVRDEYPPEAGSRAYCNGSGVAVLQELAAHLARQGRC